MTDYNQTNSYRGILSNEGNPVLFAHETLSVPGIDHLKNKINGIGRYPERVLPLAYKEDTVVLREAPDESYLEFLDHVGFERPNLLILKKDKPIPRSIINHNTLNGEYKDHTYAPFYGGEQDRKAAKRLGATFYAPESIVTNSFYDKSSFKDICRSIGLHTAEGQIFEKNSGEKVLEDLLRRYSEKTSEVIVRGTKGASGTSAYFGNKRNFKDLISQIMNDPEERFLVEEKYNIVESPSSIYSIDSNKNLFHLADTKQLLDKKLIHQGNYFPFDKKSAATFQMQMIGEKIGTEMAQSGYIGPFGIDFIITEDCEIIPTECNARMTGAIYPLDIIRRIEKVTNNKVGCAKSKNIVLPGVKSFDQLMELTKLRQLLFNGENNTGMFPFNTGNLNEGRFSAVFVGDSLDEIKSLEKSFNIFSSGYY